MSKNLSQQVVLDRRGFVAATFATVAGLGLAGCSDTSAEADKGSATGSSKGSEDTEASTTLDAKAFDKLVNDGPKADDDAIAASTWATAVKGAGVFKIGGVQTSTLFSLLNEKDGQTRGFDAGIAQLLSSYILGENKVEITQVTSDTRESVLQNGQVDAVFATYTITDERKKLVSFAGPYYYTQQAILVLADNDDIKSVDDLADKNVAVQSGSTRILKLMNRKYTREAYLDLIDRVRDRIPDIALSTDIIVGFPGETEEDFEQTLSLAEQVGYAQAFTFIYSKRDGTPAAKIDDPTPREVILERFNRLVKVIEDSAYAYNQGALGRRVPALIEGTSKKDPSRLLGKSPWNQTVHAPVPDGIEAADLVGKIVDVDVDVARTWYLSGTVVGSPR